MYEMLKNRIIDERILEGLYNISNTYEDMCSEIYVNMRISNKTSEEN